MKAKPLEKITALQDTMLLVRPEQSRKLLAEGLPNRVYQAPKGTVLSCVDLDWWEGDNRQLDADGLDVVDGDDYYWLQLAEALPGFAPLNLFAFGQHWSAEHPEPVDATNEILLSDDEKATAANLIKSASNSALDERPSKERVEDLGPTLYLPGSAFKRPRHAKEPIFWVGDKPCPFTWGEMTANCTRVPTTEAIAWNIIKVAKLLTAFRVALAQPIGIESGYRPPDVNRAVGGASRSRHLLGDAADWYPTLDGINKYVWAEVCKIQLGGGLAISAYDDKPELGFVHSDCRGDGDPLSDYAGRTVWTYPAVPSWYNGR